MVDHLTLSIGATGAGAGVNTPLPHTGSVVGTVRVDGALRSAVGRNSNVVGQTGAGSNSSCQVILTLGEGSTGRRIARINLLNNRLGGGRRWGDSLTVTEWISLVSRGTLTDGVMVGHLTPGIIATGARAGVHTLLVDAGSQLITVRADHTLWSAVWRIALIAGHTGTDTHTIDLSVLAVGAAGVWVTGVQVQRNRGWRGNQGAGRGGVSFIARVAGADGIVIAHSALGMDAAGAGAGVLALLLHTGQVIGALGVDQTLWSAAHIGVTNVVRDTSASSCPLPCSALSISTTWCRVAGIDDLRSGDHFRNEGTSGERVSCVAHWTVTDGIVVDCSTSCIVTTRSNAWVTALVLDTSFVAWTFGIEDTFRSTVWWNTNVAWQTSTGLVAIDFSALGIGATGGWHTRDVGSL